MTKKPAEGGKVKIANLSDTPPLEGDEEKL